MPDPTPTAIPGAEFSPSPGRPPPPGERGWRHWARTRLFYSPASTIFTLLTLLLLWYLAQSLYVWAFRDAIWEASTRRECLDRSPDGACWAGVRYWFQSYLYGRYPVEERWRANLGGALLILWMLPVFVPGTRNKAAVLAGAVVLYPVLAVWLFLGGPWGLVPRALAMIAAAALAINSVGALVSLRSGQSLSQFLARNMGAAGRRRQAGAMAVTGLTLALAAVLTWITRDLTLPYVETGRWGGLFLTFIIAVSSSLFAFPIGIVLALGRQSKLTLVQITCTTIIELVRSIPLITLLFMVVVLLPLFVPSGVQFNKLMQALLALSLFTSVYLAEVVRSGLQSINEGQPEAATALGLGYWHTTLLVTLPQALKTMTPVLVTHVIGNFKDTTLVSIIGMYDLLGMISASGHNPEWNGLDKEPMFFATTLFFVLCFLMSLYGRHLEKRGSGITGGSEDDRDC